MRSAYSTQRIFSASEKRRHSVSSGRERAVRGGGSARGRRQPIRTRFRRDGPSADPVPIQVTSALTLPRCVKLREVRNANGSVQLAKRVLGGGIDNKKGLTGIAVTKGTHAEGHEIRCLRVAASFNSGTSTIFKGQFPHLLRHAWLVVCKKSDVVSMFPEHETGPRAASSSYRGLDDRAWFLDLRLGRKCALIGD